MTKSDESRPTVLFDRHKRLGARMAPFGGFWMPIQYSGILAEHKAARTAAAIFDTCHMGEFRISGRTALQDLERLVSCDLAELAVGCCRYGLMCSPEGGVLDDLLVYRLDAADFMLVVNAGTQDKDHAWIAGHVSGDTALENVSGSTAKVDVQGPGSPKILRRMLGDPIDGLKYYGFQHNTFQGRTVLVSRTGYTGEVGFEIYADPPLIAGFWDGCIRSGAVPAGLGARDTLRLEMGMPLYGHELSEGRNARTAGSGSFISKTKEFIGSTAIQRRSIPKDSLVGIALEGRQAAREGSRLLSEKGSDIGIVTSGSFAPSLGHSIALGYVDSEFADVGIPVSVAAHRTLTGKIVELPFYRKGTARKPLRDFT